MSVEPWMVVSFCATIFMIGLFGLMIRKNILIMMMCVELMLNSANLAFVTYSQFLNDLSGQMAVFFVIAVAAAEAAVGLGLVVAMFRTIRSVDTDDIQLLRE